MKNLKISSFLLLCFFHGVLTGQTLMPDEARMLAEKLFVHVGKLPDVKSVMLSETEIFTDSTGEPAVYLFSEQKGGFILLSGERSAYPLLAFSGEGYFSAVRSDWPPALGEWFESIVEEIQYIRRYKYKPSSETNKTWEWIEQGDDPGITGRKSVLPLLSTTWNQGCGYNALCPVDSRGPCNRVVTGCVATAMAQVVRHNEHPVNGTGNKCYTLPAYGELCADFSTAGYNYSSMPNSSGNAEVAKLIYHCGVAVSMNYGPYGSSAYSTSVAHAMRNYFDYANGLIVSKNSYAESNWTRILKNELHLNRPIYYSGHGTSGHAFVLDGYQETDHFHVNWGWGGSYNGYYYLNSLNPGSMNFSSGQQAIVGMIPTAAFTGLDFSSAIDLVCKTPVNDNIAEGNDYVNYYKNIYPHALGKELLYRFTTTLPGRIRVKITGQTETVYTFLLHHPHKDSLLSYGMNGLTVDNTLPGTYYIVVEGFAGNEPTFTIEVICPTTEADLDISSASVSPRYVRSLQGNVNVSCRMENIGHSASGPCTMEYYFSSDTRYDAGTDILIGDQMIPPLEPGQSAGISDLLTMPPGLTPGYYYILFVADRENLVPEADDENVHAVYVTVPEEGILDCSTAVGLEDGVWYRGNTDSLGINLVEEYSMGWEMTGPEVIHSFTPLFNGMVSISFVEKSPGMLYAMVLPICNEKTSETSLRIFNLTDTLTTGEFYAIAGNEYFIVVDGHKGASGDYGLRVDLPAECPEIALETWGKTSLCDGDPWPGFWTYWGYSNYQWFRDGFPVPGATNSSFSPAAAGDYHLEITENGCTASSEIICVRMDPLPDTAQIASLGEPLFCHGGGVLLNVANTVTYPLNWVVNGEMIPGETASEMIASGSGTYSVFTVNGACALESENRIEVRSVPLPADVGEQLPFPSGNIGFYYPFTHDNNDESGNGYMLVGWDYEPADDRYGRFWQARHLRGSGEKMYSSHYDTIPGDFTLALWFKTTTTEGGPLAGFYDNPWGPAKMDAILYMSDNGKLHFWLSNEGAAVELSSDLSYNDGNWHCVVIRHQGHMSLEINEGGEVLMSGDMVSKQKFPGYWSFGGPAVPVNVSQPPSSMFLQVSIDELLCLNEGNPLILPYMVNHPALDLVISTPVILCDSGLLVIDLPYTQAGVEYRVRNKTDSAWYGVPGMGTGGPLQIGGETEISQTTEFQMVAFDTLTGCERWLDTTITVKVYPVETPFVSVSSDADSSLCAGTVIHFTATPAHAGTHPVLEWYVNGVAQGVNQPEFSLVAEPGPIEVYAIVLTDNPCALSDKAVSDTLVLFAGECATITEGIPGTGLKVYPVPASGMLCIESDEPMEEIRIYDATGRLLQHFRGYHRLVEINVGHFPRAVYHYHITTIDGKRMRGKFVVQ